MRFSGRKSSVGRFGRRRQQWVLIAALLLTCAATGAASTGESANPEWQLVQQAMETSEQQDFDGALTIARQARTAFPNSPAPVFGLVAIYQTTMDTYRVRAFDTKVDSLLDIAVRLSKQALKHDRRNGRNYFCLAMAYGSRAVRFAQRGEWLKAFRDGSQIKSNLRKAVSYSPDFYDAYYALGAYNYWIAVKTKVLSVFGNSKREGIDQVEAAVQKGRFLKTNAMYGLSAIYFNEKNYNGCLSVCDKLGSLFPANPTISYRRARVFMKMDQWQLAYKSFERTLRLLEAARFQSVTYQIDCLYHLALCSEKLGKREQAQALSRRALDLERRCDRSRETPGPYDSFDSIKNDLHRLAARL